MTRLPISREIAAEFHKGLAAASKQLASESGSQHLRRSLLDAMSLSDRLRREGRPDPKQLQEPVTL